MNTKVFVLALCCLPLVGCAYQEQEWVYPGKSLSEQSTDARACQNEADRAVAAYPPDFVLGGGQNAVEQVQRTDGAFNRCMRDKGYQLQDLDASNRR